MELKDLNILDIGNEIQMTGAVYSGKGKHFLCLFPDEHGLEPKDIVPLDMSFADWEKFLHQTDHLEVEMRLLDPEMGKIMKAINRKSQRQVEQSVSWKVFRRDAYSCRYCGRNDCPLTVDHLVLWEEGGPSIEANLVSACKKCNRTRGNMQYVDWLSSDYYLKVSRPIGSDKRFANTALVGTLDVIPRAKFVRSR